MIGLSNRCCLARVARCSLRVTHRWRLRSNASCRRGLTDEVALSILAHAPSLLSRLFAAADCGTVSRPTHFK